MSRPRMLSSAAVLLTAVVGASWYASTLFPILKAAKADVQAPAPSAVGTVASTESGWRLVLDGDVVSRTGERMLPAAEVRLEQQTGNVLAVRPVTPENPIPRRTRGGTPARPAQFGGAQVVVSSLVTLDRNGAVTAVARDGCSATDGRNNDSAVCSAFFDSVSAAIRQWRYDRPAQGPLQFYVRVTFRPAGEPTISQSGESWVSSVRETQDSLRRLAETDRDNEAVQRAVASLQADLARLTEMSRELERAQRLGERGLLAQSTLQDGMARLGAELRRVEAQLQNIRLAGDDRDRAEQQYRAVLEQYRVAEQQFRSASAQQSAEEQARTVERLRQAERQLQRSRAEGQLNQAARPFETDRDSQANLETLARAAQEAADALRRASAGDAAARAQAEAATGRLREAQRKLEASRAQRSASVEGQQLRSPSGRAPVQITSAVTRPVAIKSPKPQHSAEAMRARVEGTVTIEALVDEQGHVADARVVKSIPLLDPSALEAARQWEFRPALLNGEAVPVIVMLELEFNLRK